jgi:type II secretory pathway predicted ATPase ExeA
MYHRFFGLNESPFNVNPDPRYLFMTEHTREALACLTYGIQARKGFVLLSGEVGTGKTTLLNKLLEWLHEGGIASAFIFNPRLTVTQFFDFMMADFSIPCDPNMKSQVLLKLNRWLFERHRTGQCTVLIIDEAQNLSSETLEEIRLLSNLETSTKKLLQIVLSGQPELERKLNQPELRQLRQRIALHARTRSLTLRETAGYLKARLRVAGAQEDDIFTADAVKAVHQYSQGTPRLINLVSERALINAFADQKNPIPESIVKEVACELDLQDGDFVLREAPPRQPSHEKLQETPVKHSGSEQVPSNGFATSPDTLVEILSRLMERLDRLEAINSKGRALH